MIKNIIFDMGNVLILFRPEIFINRLNVSQQDAKLLNDIIFDSQEWASLDNGSANEDEVIEILKKKLPRRLHDEMIALVTEWDIPLIEIEGMSQLIKELKAEGYKIYLLSNASTRQHEYWPRISASQYFDGTVISADVKMVKPNPEIFEHLCAKFSLLPAECFFIDDLEQHIIAAESIGMQGYQFTGNVYDLRKVIDRL
ncbi:MAG TPA: HAD family phosphatase [Clostridiaceae bacterium]|nr:HAD family phosphatase [Clostridiaceae bacterium]